MRIQSTLLSSVLFLVATSLSLPAQTPPPDAGPNQLSGYIRHAESREVIRYALIATDSGSVRAQSTADGFYFLNLSAGSHRILVRALGFAPFDTTVSLTGRTTVDLFLQPRPVQLQQVEIAADVQKLDIDPTSAEMSISRLDLATIRQAPAALGEVDPLRSITLLPGVSRSSDFSTAFSVRGGSNDQNLILLDEATIYNPAHVFGFLSVFNSDAVADVTLYKGAIPPRFGGRLSSVLDARQREGNASRFGATATIGLLASRALLEGPLPGTKGSFLIAARRSYADIFLKAAPDTSIRDARAYFYDLNAKANVPIGNTGTIMASAYAGRDLFSPAKEFEAGWGNLSGTLRWNQIFATRLFSKLSLTRGDYDYRLGFDLLEGTVDWTSRISSKELRLEESWHFSERNILEFGAEIAGQTIRPADLQPADTTKIRPITLAPRFGRSGALYAGHVFDLAPRLTLNYGLRVSQFWRRAPSLIYQYADDAPVRWNEGLRRYEPSEVVDSTRQSSGTIADFGGPEPRVSLRLGLTPTSSVKASFARTRQYLLLATRTNAPTPLDVWEPVGTYVKPQRGDQYAVGYASSLADGGYEVSVEGYFKRLYNVLDFVEGSDVILNPRIETAFLQGIGRAYGLEAFVRKQVGDLTGWVSYTLSKSEQRFRAGTDGGINNGEWFPSPIDKTHDLSVVAIKPIGRRWTFGSTFSLATGLPTTYPVSRYQLDDYVIPEYGPRNGARLPMYHRLDISFTRSLRRGELQLGAFNVYNRFNAQSMSFRQSVADPTRTEAVRLSIFGVVPSISYTYRFR